MGSTLRNDTSKAIFLERLARARDKRPDLTFGQLLAGALEQPDIVRRNDGELAVAFGTFALLDLVTQTLTTFLDRVAQAWDARPDLSFGELLCGAMEQGAPVREQDAPRRIARLSDAEIAGAVEKFVLLDAGPGSGGGAAA